MAPEWHKHLTVDTGWNSPAFDGAEDITPARNKVLKTKILDRNLVCMSGGNIYVFLTTINTWSIICSHQATVFLNNLMSMESATVRYSNAFIPYVEFIERNASNKIAQPIPTSICIGTTRLLVSASSSGLKLSPCHSLIPAFPEDVKVPAGLCYMSLAIPYWPPDWERTSVYPMYNYLSPLFEDPAELRTIEWAIGHALVDPHSYSKAVVLYGPGGRGKSTMLAALNIALMGCCGSIPDKALVSLAKGLPDSIASIIVANRIVTAGDVGGLEENTNLSVIKTLTGHDYISVPPSRARSACTLFYASNRLDDPLRNPEWTTDAIMRRVVVILMNTCIVEGISDSIPQDPVSRLDFALRCVHTKLTYPHMPVSPMSVLLTLLGSQATKACKYVVPVSDIDVDEDEIMVANSIIGGYIGKTAEEVGKLAHKISPSCVCSIRGRSYVKNIAPSSKYTE